MGIVQIKEALYHYIERADVRLLKMLYAVAKEYTEENYTRAGEPMSEETLKSRIAAAKSRIKAGRFTTQEDLEKEIKEW